MFFEIIEYVSLAAFFASFLSLIVDAWLMRSAPATKTALVFAHGILFLATVVFVFIAFLTAAVLLGSGIPFFFVYFGAPFVTGFLLSRIKKAMVGSNVYTDRMGASPADPRLVWSNSLFSVLCWFSVLTWLFYDLSRASWN